MKLSEKLEKLIGEGRQASIAREAGIGRTALNKYINGGSSPSALTALKLARVLRVPLDWLVDPDTALPAPAVDKSDLEHIPTGDLFHELTRRYMARYRELLAEIESLEGLEWQKIMRDAYEPEHIFDHGAHPNPSINRLIHQVGTLEERLYDFKFHYDVEGNATVLEALDTWPKVEDHGYRFNDLLQSINWIKEDPGAYQILKLYDLQERMMPKGWQGDIMAESSGDAQGVYSLRRRDVHGGLYDADETASQNVGRITMGSPTKKKAAHKAAREGRGSRATGRRSSKGGSAGASPEA